MERKIQLSLLNTQKTVRRIEKSEKHSAWRFTEN